MLDHLPSSSSTPSISWLSHFKRWKQSSLSQREYCHKYHLKFQQFAYQRSLYLHGPQQKKKSLPSSQASSKDALFVPVKIAASSVQKEVEASPVVLESPTGFRLIVPEHFSEKAIIKILNILKEHSC